MLFFNHSFYLQPLFLWFIWGMDYYVSAKRTLQSAHIFSILSLQQNLISSTLLTHSQYEHCRISCLGGNTAYLKRIQQTRGGEIMFTESELCYVAFYQHFPVLNLFVRVSSKINMKLESVKVWRKSGIPTAEMLIFWVGRRMVME
jgi:hypothetical protein